MRASSQGQETGVQQVTEVLQALAEVLTVVGGWLSAHKQRDSGVRRGWYGHVVGPLRVEASEVLVAGLPQRANNLAWRRGKLQSLHFLIRRPLEGHQLTQDIHAFPFRVRLQCEVPQIGVLLPESKDLRLSNQQDVLRHHLGHGHIAREEFFGTSEVEAAGIDAVNHLMMPILEARKSSRNLTAAKPKHSASSPEARSNRSAPGPVAGN